MSRQWKTPYQDPAADMSQIGREAGRLERKVRRHPKKLRRHIQQVAKAHAAAIKRALNDRHATARRQAVFDRISRSSAIQSEPLEGGFPAASQAKAGCCPSAGVVGNLNSGSGQNCVVTPEALVNNPARVNHEKPQV